MRYARLAVAVFAVAALLTGPAVGQEKQAITFALNWSPTDHHIAYWVALEKGFYADKGLDVELQNSKGSSDAVAKVDIGRAQFGLSDATTVVPAIARGADIKIVATVFNSTPLAFFVWDDSPVQTPKDLEGRTLGSPPGDAHRTFFPAFAKATDIAAEKVSWVNIDPAAKVGALLTKRVDAMADFTTIGPLYEKAMGSGNVRVLPWSEYGFDLYGLAIVTRSDTIRDNPDLVRRFLEATYEGWRAVFADPKGSVEIFKQKVPELDAEVISRSLHEKTFPLVKTAATVENGIGWINPEKMCATVSLVNESMSLPKSVGCDGAYDDRLLPVIKFAQ